MNITIIIHSQNADKLRNLFRLINKRGDKNNFILQLHAKNYIPWEFEDIKNEIISFKEYSAFPTEKPVNSSIVELISKTKTKDVLILDEDCESIQLKPWDNTYYNFLFCQKNDILKFNLDTKYHTLKWFIIDVLTQKHQKTISYNDNSTDYKRYVDKLWSPLIKEKIIYIDGGLGDHIMALPLLEKIGKDVYVSCKYEFVYDFLPIKGFVNWNDELYGGYSRFVYEYGSANNSPTIIDAFFNMYGYDRDMNDILKYNGKRESNPEIQTNKKIALICTSAAKINNQDSNKDWRDIRWFKLVNELQKKNYYVIQVGTSKDNQIPNVDYKFLDKPLSNLASLIDNCNLWISVDTFFHHFASAIKPTVGICLTPFYNNHAKHFGVLYIEKDCGKNYHDRRWWMDLQQPERKECMDLIMVEDVLEKII